MTTSNQEQHDDPDYVGMLYNLTTRTIAPDENGVIKARVTTNGSSTRVTRGTGKADTASSREFAVAPMYDRFALNEGPTDNYGMQPYDDKRKLLRERLRKLLDEV